MYLVSELQPIAVASMKFHATAAALALLYIASLHAYLPNHVIDAVVHGCPDSTDVDDALADAMNYVTVVPHPCTQGLSLQVHLISNALCTYVIHHYRHCLVLNWFSVLCQSVSKPQSLSSHSFELYSIQYFTFVMQASAVAGVFTGIPLQVC